MPNTRTGDSCEALGSLRVCNIVKVPIEGRFSPDRSFGEENASLEQPDSAVNCFLVGRRIVRNLHWSLLGRLSGLEKINFSPLGVKI
jgi:hypothetical protein